MPEASPADNILVVDDDPASLHTLQGLLEGSGFRVHLARSGNEALERVAPAQPDLILLDVAMPGMDGYTTCELLKTDARYHWIPVIMLSDAAYSDVALRCLDVGASDFVRIPYEAEELLAKVRAALRAHREDLSLLENQGRLVAQIASEEQRKERLRLEAAFATAINDAPDLGAKADLIREYLPDVLGVSLFSVFAHDPGTNTLRVIAHNSPRLKNLSSIPLVRGTVMGECVVTGRPVFIENFTSSRFYRPAPDRPYVRNSCITIPLRLQQQVVGLLNLHDKIAGEFVQEDLLDGQRVGAFMASALENAYHQLNSYDEALRDRVTGLFNRRYMDEHLGRMLKLCKRLHVPVACILAAIDNPGKGAAWTSDAAMKEGLLRQIGLTFTRQCRDTDIVSHYVPERYLLVLPATDAGQAVILAERLQETVAKQEYGLSLNPIRVTLGMGIAAFPENGWEASSLLQGAIKALEGARSRGPSSRGVAPPIVPSRGVAVDTSPKGR